MAIIKNRFKTAISTISAFLHNVKVIWNEGGFANQDTNNLYGEEGRQYFVVFPFSTGKKFIGTNCNIRSITNIIPMWTYTGTDYAIENVLGGRVSIDQINIQAPNGTVLHIRGGNNGNLLERMNVSDMILGGKKIAFIDGAGAAILNTATFSVDGTVQDAITVNSTSMQIFNMEKVVFTGVPAGGSAVDLGISTIQEIEHENIVCPSEFNSPLAHVYKGLADSGNILTGGSFTFRGGNFVGLTNPLVGIKVNDKRMLFSSDNDGNIDATQTLGKIYLTNTATANITAVGVYAEMINGTFVEESNGKISYTSRGGIKNESEKAVYFLMIAEFVLDTGGTTNLGVSLYYDNGTTETEIPESHKDYSSNQDKPVSCIAAIKLNPQDEVFPKFENNTNNSTYDINNYTLIISKTA